MTQRRPPVVADDRRMISLMILPSVKRTLDHFAQEDRRSRSAMIEHMVFRLAELHEQDRRMLLSGAFARRERADGQ